MGYCRLADASLCHDLIHTKARAAAYAHDLLSRFIRERFGKFHCIHAYYYIDICLYVKWHVSNRKTPFGVLIDQSNFLI